jgi:MFS family permease
VRLVEAVLPARMGAAFRWLIGATWLSNLGDGIAVASGPLLIAQQTADPLLVAAGAFLQKLPWLLLGLYAGVLADRHDRRTLMVTANALRVVVLVTLAAVVLADVAGVAVVLLALFVLGVAEAFADTASGTLLPMVVDKDDLGVGAARVMACFLTANQLLGPAVGALLFSVAMAAPFLAHALLVAGAIVLVGRMRIPPLQRPPRDPHVWRDVREGLAWTWRHPPVRTLTVTIVTFNVTYGAAWSVLVLYADQRLGLGAVGFGLLSTFVAVGGVAGTLGYDWLERRARLSTLMRAVLIVETLTHLGLALTTTGWVAMVIMVVFGAEVFVWGTLSTAVRMRATPPELQGRVGSLYSVGVFGGILVGQAIGGMIAHVGGITAPYWFAFCGSALILAGLWRALGHIESPS